MALMEEAKPLIERFKLRRSGDLSLFENGEMALLVTKSGVIQTAFQMGRLQKRYKKWLNIGVAGARSDPVGSLFLIDKVTFAGKSAYPKLPFRADLKRRSLQTVTTIETEFASDALYDMEGYAFFRAASHYTSSELIHLIKIVSDNRIETFHTLTKSCLSRLIASNLPAIENFIDQFLHSSNPPEEISLTPYELCFHMTKSQKLQLKELLEKCRALSILPKTDHCHSAKDLIAHMEMLLARERLSFD